MSKKFYGIRKDNGDLVIGESFKKVGKQTFIGSGSITWVEVVPTTVTVKEESENSDND